MLVKISTYLQRNEFERLEHFMGVQQRLCRVVNNIDLCVSYFLGHIEPTGQVQKYALWPQNPWADEVYTQSLPRVPSYTEKVPGTWVFSRQGITIRSLCDVT